MTRKPPSIPHETVVEAAAMQTAATPAPCDARRPSTAAGVRRRAPDATAALDDMAAARRALQRRQWQHAVASLQRVIAREPRNADAHGLLGDAYRCQRSMDASFAHYAKALEIDPHHRRVHACVGAAYLAVGRPEHAERHLAMLRHRFGAACEEARALAARIIEYREHLSQH
jgi:Tfp pilus assembly protein PilF